MTTDTTPAAPVLIVEDHDDTREMIATLLGLAGTPSSRPPTASKGWNASFKRVRASFSST